MITWIDILFGVGILFGVFGLGILVALIMTTDGEEVKR